MALNEKWIAFIEENEELLTKVLPLAPEEAQKVLAENGHDFTIEEILEAGKEIYAIHESSTKEGELTEEDLDDVAGGALITVVKTICKAAGAAMQVW